MRRRLRDDGMMAMADGPLLVFGSRSLDVRLRAEPSAEPEALRAGHRAATVGRGGGGAGARAGERRRARMAARGRLPGCGQALLGRPGQAAGGRHRAGRRSGLRRNARGGGDGRRRLDPGDGGDPARRGRARLPSRRRAAPRHAERGPAASASTTTSPWRLPGPEETACASCTSIWTCTTETASRRSMPAMPECSRSPSTSQADRSFPGPDSWTSWGRGARPEPASTSRSSRRADRMPGWRRSAASCPPWLRRSGRM